MSYQSDTEDVLIEVRQGPGGGTGIITLNRPKAINSLNGPMVSAIAKALAVWEHDDQVRAVVLTGAGERGLCAGGDVVAIYHDAKSGDGSASVEFWREEYRLNDYIAKYPKPYVAVMDGIVMGGGVGVAAHGNTRVVTDTSKIGMPEVSIGFMPDVGGTYLLSRAPGNTGLHAGLTGAPFGAGDAIALGFADHYVPHSDIPALIDAIIESSVAEALATFSQPAPSSPLLAERNWIDEAFDGATVGDILDRLRARPEEAAHAAADLIAAKSPTSLAVTLRAIRQARELPDLQAVLRQEFVVSGASLTSPDLVEGIRAQLIDKDRNPQWQPATVAQISEADVARFFESTADNLTFPSDSQGATS